MRNCRLLIVPQIITTKKQCKHEKLFSDDKVRILNINRWYYLKITYRNRIHQNILIH